jgi:hypothetical protein
MNDDVVKFWKEYIRSNEVNKERLLQTLPIFNSKEKCKVIVYTTLSMFRSYIDDVIEVCKNE